MCYSYGVLLPEMFTGKRPTDSMFRLSTALLRRLFLNMWKPLVIQHSFIKEKWGCQAQSIQTPQTHSTSSGHKIREFLVSILQIGVVCSHELPTERMDVKDVVTQLHAIRNTMLGTGVLGGKIS